MSPTFSGRPALNSLARLSPPTLCTLGTVYSPLRLLLIFDLGPTSYVPGPPPTAVIPKRFGLRTPKSFCLYGLYLLFSVLEIKTEKQNRPNRAVVLWDRAKHRKRRRGLASGQEPILCTLPSCGVEPRCLHLKLAFQIVTKAQLSK